MGQKIYLHLLTAERLSDFLWKKVHRCYFNEITRRYDIFLLKVPTFMAVLTRSIYKSYILRTPQTKEMVQSL